MESANTIISIAHVYIAEHDYMVKVSMCTVSRRIHIFKYNNFSCEYDQFDCQLLASRFLEKPIKDYRE